MENVTLGETHEVKIDLPTDPDGDEVNVFIYHEWGLKKIIDGQATKDGPRKYSFSIDGAYLVSHGIHRVSWKYKVGGDDVASNDFFYVFQSYIDRGTFFDRNPEAMNEYEDKFAGLERIARNIIDSYCGQEFQPTIDNSNTFDAKGKDSLFLGGRLDSFSLVEMGGEDITDQVFYDTNTKLYLRRNEGFRGRVKVTGDWGWPFIPQNIELAAEQLILDQMNADRDNHKYGVIAAWAENQRFEFSNKGGLSTTGNLDVDVLLMDYTLFWMDYV